MARQHGVDDLRHDRVVVADDARKNRFIEIYMLDAELKSVPIGEIGELFIGGDGVARGYWNRPDLTAERFLSVPSVSEQRIYRTGDLARFLPDGNIEFLGRADYQIKLRGHRIEPGEIEADSGAMPRSPASCRRGSRRPRGRQAPGCLPRCRIRGTETSRLCAARSESKLPDYMVPSAFVFLPALPLTENGKIDRKALLKLPPPSLTAGADVAQPGSEPSSEIERIVARVWQEALGSSQRRHERELLRPRRALPHRR